MTTNPRRIRGRDQLRRHILRTQTHCHLCGQRVDVKLPAGLPASPEVDELIPIAFGGSPVDRSNCLLSHRWCNRYRWHKPYEPIRAELHASPPIFDSAGQRHDTNLEPIVSRTW